MFADDSDIHHFYLGSLLPAFHGIDLLYAAKNGQELLTFLEDQEGRPDVGIVDLHMPILDGIMTAEKLMKRYPEIRIYGFTSSSDSREKATMLAAGIYKIYAKNELKQLLTEINPSF